MAPGGNRALRRERKLLGALEARFRAVPGRSCALLELKDRLAHRSIESVAAGIDIGEDRRAHPRVPELLDVVGDARNDLVLLLVLEELAELVRHMHEAVGLHGSNAPVNKRGLGYSAAIKGAATRRAWRDSSSYSSCHSDGPFDGITCTAVTLYSGQLVAQSENSVVTTLACVSG